jgi:hypothetical protein
MTKHSEASTIERRLVMSLARDTRGAQLAGYLLVTGLVGILAVAAVAVFNDRSDQAISNNEDKAAALTAADQDPGTSFAAEVAKETAVALASGAIADAMMAPAGAAAAGGIRRGKGGAKERNLPGERKVAACKGEKCTTSGTCFVAGTLVLTPTGPRAIEDLQVGDLVLAPADLPAEL